MYETRESFRRRRNPWHVQSLAGLIDHYGMEVTFGLLVQVVAAVAVGYHSSQLLAVRAVVPGILTGFLLLALDAVVLGVHWGRHRDAFRTPLLALVVGAAVLTGLSFLVGPVLTTLGYHLPLR
jgi:hypothetical protein